LNVPVYKAWQLLAYAGWTHPVSLETQYLGGILQATHYDFREVVPVYASHGIRIEDQTVFAGRHPADAAHGGGGGAAADDEARERSTGRRLLGLLALTLVIGYFVSFASTLVTEYHYAASKDPAHKVPINDWGASENPKWHVLQSTLQYEKGVYDWKNNPIESTAIGFGITAALALLRLRFVWWPLHPIGFLMMGTFPGNHLWFSIMIGWLAKTLIVRFGGPRAFVSGKPFFLGLIVGESAAAGFWLVMGIVLSLFGVDYRPVNIMPG
jgi:hypothetical protein